VQLCAALTTARFKLLPLKISPYTRLLLLLILLIPALGSYAQEKDRKVIQFSGIVVTGDSLSPVPYVTVMIKNKYRGTSSDYYGYFSLAAESGDSLVFSSLGFKKSYYQVPEDLEEDRYSIVHVLQTDTLLLNETVIYPWPSREQFRDAFMALNIPDDEIARAQRNLEPEEMARQAQAMPNTGSMNFKVQNQVRNEKLYYTGQAPPIQLLNPFAWASFIKAWQEGKYKRKDTKRD
jgi:hypothetical protein